MPVKQRRKAPSSRTSLGQLVMGGWSGLEPNKPKAARARPEFDSQCELFVHLRHFAKRYPVLHWVHASLNGVPLNGKAARDASASGMVPGIHDLFLPARRHGFAGLYIEMKNGRNNLTPEQQAFKDHVIAEGYAVRVCWHWIDALYHLSRYCSIRDEELDQVLHVNRKAGVKYATRDPLAAPTTAAVVTPPAPAASDDTPNP